MLASESKSSMKSRISAVVTLTLERRGFLRNVALAVGALLVGVGRSAAGITMSEHCVYCNGKCSDKSCPSPTVPLTWQTDGGSCVECYESEAARQEAKDEALKLKLSDPCYYCVGVRCGYYAGPSSGGNNGLGQENPLGVFHPIGAGCFDPATEETSPWSEPGDACTDREPEESPTHPT